MSLGKRPIVDDHRMYNVDDVVENGGHAQRGHLKVRRHLRSVTSVLGHDRRGGASNRH